MPPEHHACLITLPIVSLEAALSYYGDTSQFEIRVCTYSMLSIEDARGIIDIALLRPTKGAIQLVIVLAEGINFAAEQALLKVLEEPPLSTRFLFILPSSVRLATTLLSRFFVMNQNHEPIASQAEFITFMATSYGERLELISNKMLKKDLIWVGYIRAGLEQYVRTLGTGKNSTKKWQAYALVLERITRRGAANKMLLEELAFLLPVRAVE